MKDAYSSDGYIINQALTSDISYGNFHSDRNGCGWISAYNLLKACGFPVSASEIHDEMEHRLWFFGLIGSNPLSVYFYMKHCLKRKGLLLRKAFRIRRAVELCHALTAGIILYWHGRGLHYVAFYRHHGQVFRFLNARYGDQRHFASIEEFLTEQNRGKFVFMFGTSSSLHT